MVLQLIKNNSSIIILVLASWCLKFLLIPGYYSTDFAVHQNWLRITHQLPISQWYTDAQSKWTLDYPPLFAYFQYILSIIANIFNPSIVKTINQFPQTIIFQRLSVILTDVFYLWSILKFNNYIINLKVVLMYLWIPFVILDNLHFQYNLLMQSILILCVGFMEQKKYLKASFCYATLLNFKHIYLYCSPAFFFVIIRQYILGKSVQQNNNNNQTIKQQKNKETSLNKLGKFLIVALIPFFISFGPFFIVGGVAGIKQILSRMFPFSRGLIHHYWAPNFWAIYYFLDKVLATLGYRSQMLYQVNNTNFTVNKLKVLPEISPKITVIIILSLLTPIIISYFLSKKKVKFVKLVAICGLVFFMFGFHVHEKAIVPYLNILFMFSSQTICLNAAIFVNIVNLIPLLVQPKQKTFCVVICLLWLALWDFLEQKKRDRLFRIQQSIYKQLNFARVKQISQLYLEYFIQVSGFLIVIFHLFVHPFIKRPNIQFLPLMMNSVWAAILNFAQISFLYYRFVKQYAIDSFKASNVANDQWIDQQNTLLNQ